MMANVVVSFLYLLVFLVLLFGMARYNRFIGVHHRQK